MLTGVMGREQARQTAAQLLALTPIPTSTSTRRGRQQLCSLQRRTVRPTPGASWRHRPRSWGCTHEWRCGRASSWASTGGRGCRCGCCGAAGARAWSRSRGATWPSMVSVSVVSGVSGVSGVSVVSVIVSVVGVGATWLSTQLYSRHSPRPSLPCRAPLYHARRVRECSLRRAALLCELRAPQHSA